MLSANSLLQDAKTASGLDDYGNMDFAEGLQVLVNAINTEALLTPENEARFRLELLRLLENRLRMQHDVKRHPEILEQEILPPVYITSLPRTGSTKLHRMLAASEDFHSIKYWQGRYFAPLPGGEPGKPDPRIAATEEYLAWVRQRAPLFIEGHPAFADETDEETLLLDAGFNSLYLHAAYLNVPSYVQWVLTLDPTWMFKDMRSILQYMQWQHFGGKRRRWLLKTPSLLGTEEVFAKVFPGTDFIVTHRHPELVLASAAALLCGALEHYNDGDYSGSAGEIMLANFSETVKRHLQWRDSYPADKVLDVRFDDIVHKEFEVLPRIYEFLGIPFTGASRENIRQWLAMDAARRQPSRRFTLTQYGLDAPRVNEKFSGYIQRYGAFL